MFKIYEYYLVTYIDVLRDLDYASLNRLQKIVNKRQEKKLEDRRFLQDMLRTGRISLQKFMTAMGIFDLYNIHSCGFHFIGATNIRIDPDSKRKFLEENGVSHRRRTIDVVSQDTVIIFVSIFCQINVSLLRN